MCERTLPLSPTVIRRSPVLSSSLLLLSAFTSTARGYAKQSAIIADVYAVPHDVISDTKPSRRVMGLLQLRFEHDTSTTRYNTLRGFSCARIRDRFETPRESVVGVSCMLIDSSMHTAFTLYLYRPTLHRVCEYARNCLYKRN